MKESVLGRFWFRLKAKILAEHASPTYVARGWALGMFIGCFIPFGLQLLVSVPLSFVLRASKVGATMGTLITNPVTIFFLYPAQTWVGSRLLGTPLTWDYLVEVCGRLAKISLFTREGWQTLSDIGSRVLGGFFLGGFLLAVLLTPITYLVVYRMVLLNQRLVQYRRARRFAREEKQAL